MQRLLIALAYGRDVHPLVRAPLYAVMVLSGIRIFVFKIALTPGSCLFKHFKIFSLHCSIWCDSVKSFTGYVGDCVVNQVSTGGISIGINSTIFIVKK